MTLKYKYKIEGEDALNSFDGYVDYGEIIQLEFVRDDEEDSVATVVIERVAGDETLQDRLDEGNEDACVISDALDENSTGVNNTWELITFGSDLFVIHKLTVNAECRAQGIGSEIMQNIVAIVQRISETIHPAIVLIPGAYEIPHERKEERAKADAKLRQFYRRFGFKPMCKHYNVMYNHDVYKEYQSMYKY